MAGLLPTPEQDELRKVVRGLVAQHADTRRAVVDDGGIDDVAWRALVDQVGVTGLAVPEHLGGSGFGWGEMAVVLEEIGYGLLPVPVLSSVVLATTALLEAETSDVVDDTIKQLVGGARGAVALPLGVDEQAIDLVIEDDRLSGTQLVLEADGAEVLLALARTAAGTELHLLDPRQVSIQRTEGVDLVRHVATLGAERVETTRLGTLDADALRRLRDSGRLALACEQVGAARACLDMAVAYAKQRTQFGRPIGSFQALKHQLADVFVGVEAATAALAGAVRTAVEEPRHFGDAADLATSTAGTVLHDAAEANIHVHGGIGFTWEHDAHLYYRRALATNALFGHPDDLDRRRGAGLVG